MLQVPGIKASSVLLTKSGSAVLPLHQGILRVASVCPSSARAQQLATFLQY